VTQHHLAQINIARFRAPKTDPANSDFMAALDHVNALAEASPGFIWRLVGAGDNAVDIDVADDPRLAVNLSVWEDMESLAAFAYRNADHRAVMRRRKEWFEPMAVYMALWWVPRGHRPTADEGLAQLALLERLGPTQEAFVFAAPYPAPGQASAAPLLERCD
jgi:heme-degrading monooxygenase HmoA